jgi:hypothetical protein
LGFGLKENGKASAISLFIYGSLSFGSTDNYSGLFKKICDKTSVLSKAFKKYVK